MLPLPWKLKLWLVSFVGEDRLFNKVEYIPDFSFRSLDVESVLFENTDNRLKSQSVATYFLSRANKGFFIGIADVQRLACRLEQSRPEWRAAIVDLADAMCRKGLPVYNYSISPIGSPFDWSDLRRGPHDDILYLVRPHRFTFAAVLSQAALFEERFFEPLDSVVTNWITYTKKTKYKWPYYSNLVVIYRILSLTWSWHFVGALNTMEGIRADKLITKILSIISSDVRFLSSRLGKSHHNNHLLADYFIGWFINQFYPEFVGGTDFSNFEGQWLFELKRQFYNDGGNFEHSTHYQELGCQLAVIYLLIKRENKQQVDVEIKELIERIMSFHITLAGPENRMWPIGDLTEDSLFVLDTGCSFATSALREIYSVIFQPALPSIKTDVSALNAFWMLKDRSFDIHGAQERESAFYKFRRSGIFKLSDRNNDLTFLLRMGVAPGTNYSPGHMNSDMLSIFLRHKGQDVLTPAGTYSYIFDNKGAHNFRKHLTSRQSQNAFIIENSDPLGKLTGNFRDADNGARVNSIHIEDDKIGYMCEGTIESDNEYNGYLRGILGIPGCYTVIYERIPENCYASEKGFGWQFCPAVSVEIMSSGTVIAAHEQGAITLLPSANISTPAVYLGEYSPLRGWVSQQYGKIVPAPYVFYPINDNEESAGFLFHVKDKASYSSLETTLIDKRTLMITIQGNSFKDTILINEDNTAVTGLNGLPSFEGKMLYFREDNATVKAIRSLAIKNICWPEMNLRFTSGGDIVNANFRCSNDCFLPIHAIDERS